MKDGYSIVFAYLMALFIKFVFGIVLPSYLIAHGFMLMGIDISAGAVGWVLIGVWLIFGTLLPSYNTKVSTDDK